MAFRILLHFHFSPKIEKVIEPSAKNLSFITYFLHLMKIIVYYMRLTSIISFYSKYSIFSISPEKELRYVIYFLTSLCIPLSIRYHLCLCGMMGAGMRLLNMLFQSLYRVAITFGFDYYSIHFYHYL